MSKKIYYKELIMLVVLAIYLFSVFFIQNSMLNLNPTMSGLVSVVKNFFLLSCIIIAIFFNRYTMKEIVIILSLLLLFIITDILAGSSPLLELLIFIVGLKEVPLKSILKTYLLTSLISYVGIILLNFLSVIPDRLVIRDGIERSSLGFWHPNTTSLGLLTIYLLAMYLSKDKYKVLLTIIFGILSMVVYTFTNSRTSMILILVAGLFTLISYIFRNAKYNILGTKHVLPFIFIGLTVISWIVSILYIHQNALAIQLSQLLSNRISLGARFIQEYGLSLFGQPIQYNSSNNLTQVVIGFQYRVLDNVYLKYLLNYGIISIVGLFLYLYILMYKLNKKNRILVNMYLLIYLFYGLAEQSAFNATVNFFMCFGVILFTNKKNNEFLNE